MMLHSTISSHYVNILVNRLREQNYDVNALLLNAKVPVDTLNNNQTRISIQRFCELFGMVQVVMQDESIGYYLRPQKIGTLQVVVNYMASASSVRKALLNAVEMYNLLDLGMQLSVHEDKQFLKFRVNADEKIACSWVYEEFLTKIHRIVRWLANHRVPINRVNLPFDEVGHKEEYSLLFGAKCFFNMPHAELVFSLNDVEIPLEKPSSDVKKSKDEIRFGILLTTVTPKSYVEKVRLAIKNNLPQSCLYEEVSKQLAMHPQTLRRRLHEEGTEFKKIKADIIRDLAIEYLSTKEFSVKQVAYMLNFSAPSSFNRAFKKWTGLSPVAFQKSSFED